MYSLATCQVRTRRGRRIVLFLERRTPHKARTTQALAAASGIKVRWLRVAWPEMNPVDYLWRHIWTEDWRFHEAVQEQTDLVE